MSTLALFVIGVAILLPLLHRDMVRADAKRRARRRIRVILKADTRQFEAAMRKAGNAMQAFGATVERVGRAIEKHNEVRGSGEAMGDE